MARNERTDAAWRTFFDENEVAKDIRDRACKPILDLQETLITAIRNYCDELCAEANKQYNESWNTSIKKYNKVIEEESMKENNNE